MRVGMAAAIEHRVPHVADLRRVRAKDLTPLLEEEIAEWQARLDWDFRPSADLVRRYVALESLAGYALIVGGAVAGYTYLEVTDRQSGQRMQNFPTWKRSRIRPTIGSRLSTSAVFPGHISQHRGIPLSSRTTPTTIWLRSGRSKASTFLNARNFAVSRSPDP